MSALKKLLERRRLLIFDFDGTIADTSPLHAQAFGEVLAPRGITVDYSAIAGMKTGDALRKCLEVAIQQTSEEELAGMIALKQRLVRDRIATGLRPLPGADEFLQWAAPRFQLCLVTSGSRGTVGMALDKLGYSDLFAPCLCAEDVARAKPDPEGFLAALRLTATDPAEAVVFEDSAAGFAAAQAAGLSFFDARNNLWRSLNEVSP